MYRHDRTFKGFGDIAGAKTITLKSGETFTWHGDTWFLDKLKKDMGWQADILSFTEPRTAGQFIVTFKPKVNMSDEEWVRAFIAVFNDLGYKGVSYQKIESGAESSAVGGVSALPGAIGKGAWEMTKGILPIGILILGGLLFLTPAGNTLITAFAAKKK